MLDVKLMNFITTNDLKKYILGRKLLEFIAMPFSHLVFNEAEAP